MLLTHSSNNVFGTNKNRLFARSITRIARSEQDRQSTNDEQHRCCVDTRCQRWAISSYMFGTETFFSFFWCARGLCCLQHRPFSSFCIFYTMGFWNLQRSSMYSLVFGASQGFATCKPRSFSGSRINPILFKRSKRSSYCGVLRCILATHLSKLGVSFIGKWNKHGVEFLFVCHEAFVHRIPIGLVLSIPHKAKTV